VDTSAQPSKASYHKASGEKDLQQSKLRFGYGQLLQRLSCFPWNVIKAARDPLMAAVNTGNIDFRLRDAELLGHQTVMKNSGV